ncbi:MAG: dTDP-4-dehydrorhamnose 3,5-epimerase [Gammaproteobacteria bacterium]|nr:dTDP-4-dehydrorhamnose 3,5-epimerase [Gammaproteobacteria bacterium]
MNIIETNLPGVLLIEPKVFGDQRGFFLETFQAERYKEIGIELDFVQDNLSRSSKGVLRGLHYQLNYPQGKLVSVIRGKVFDVAVDIRQGSPHFGKWFGAELSDENHHQLYVPPGFAHGFCVMSDTVDFQYKCTDYYHPEDEVGIIWNDPSIAVDWSIADPTLSDKDKQLLALSELSSEQLPKYIP